MSAQTPLPAYVNAASIRDLTGVTNKHALSTDGSTLYVEGITQVVLDNAMTTYYADQETYVIQPMRDSVKGSLSTQVYSFISDSYSVQIQQMFQALLTEASILGLANRIIYIQQLLEWVKTIVAYNLTVDDSVDAAVTPEDILAITLDLTPFEATNPSITVKAALEIPD